MVISFIMGLIETMAKTNSFLKVGSLYAFVYNEYSFKWFVFQISYILFWLSIHLQKSCGECGLLVVKKINV